jgi:hypothetical protein
VDESNGGDGRSGATCTLRVLKGRLFCVQQHAASSTLCLQAAANRIILSSIAIFRPPIGDIFPLGVRTLAEYGEVNRIS